MAALPSAQGYWVALSGGLDSMVLAHLALRFLPSVRLIHINHGLSPHALIWQQQVEAWARANNVAIKSVCVRVDKQTASLEAAARSARYAVFEQTLAEGEALLCGHHLNDQAETMLLRLLRGSGLKGLASMAPARALGAGVLLRPLLGLSRAQLQAYAQVWALPWVEDESNQDLRFERNWLRNELIPQITARWPSASQQLAQTCLRLQEEHALLHEYLASDLAACAPRPERLGQSLLLAPLGAGSAARRRSLLRLWFAQLELLPPSQAVLQQMEQLIDSRQDAEGCVGWGRWQLHRFADRLYAVPQIPLLAAHWQTRWDTQTPLRMPNGASISAQPCEKGLVPGVYDVRLRQGGERCHPAWRAHSQTLKKLLQEAALEPWLRGLMPLLYENDCLVAVGDLWVERGFCVAGGVTLNWQFNGG
jgi:tRNA(Ile)-lysidine synthase